MERELICKWLGLPPERWPPDHYTLLGLSPGESDVRTIEEHTHDRLAVLRQYQLNHPDQVTEAMNRLAEAFSCLTDLEAKKAYDVSLGKASAAIPSRKSDTALRKAGRTSQTIPKVASASAPSPLATEPAATKELTPKSTPTVPIAKLPAPAPPPAASPSSPPPSAPAPDTAPAPEPAAVEGAAPSPDPLAWLFGPWSAPATQSSEPSSPSATPPVPATPAPPAVGDWKTEPPPARVTMAADAPLAAPNPEPETLIAIPPPVESPPPADVRQDTMKRSAAARGLGTKRQLYHRLATTRQLINAWKRTGRFLANPERRLTRLADANDLVREFADIEDLLGDFPPLMGEAGQPGYLVLALAKQPSVVPTFRGLSESQREALARDWNAALEVLLQHRDFLRQEVLSLRRKSRLARLIRATRVFCSDHSLSFLICAGVLALLLSIWTYYKYRAS